MPPRRLPEIFTRLWLRIAIAALLFVILSTTLPRWWCGRQGHRWYEGDARLALAHARDFAAHIGDTEKPSASAPTDDTRFQTLQLGAIALLQLVREHPELGPELLPPAERAIEGLLTEPVRGFDTHAWGEDALASLDSDRPGHAAALGPLNLVLSLHRRLVPDSRFGPLNDRVSAALVRRLRASLHGLLETRPGEARPADNAAALASLLVRSRALGEAPPDVAATMLARFRLSWRDPSSGLIHRAINPADGRPAGPPRADDTLLAAALIAQGDHALAKELYEDARDRCAGVLLGFGFIDLHPVGAGRSADAEDDARAFLGASPEASIHALACSRVFGDRHAFVLLYRSVHLVAAPVAHGEGRSFAAADALDNARLLAALTAPPALQ